MVLTKRTAYCKLRVLTIANLGCCTKASKPASRHQSIWGLDHSHAKLLPLSSRVESARECKMQRPPMTPSLQRCDSCVNPELSLSQGSTGESSPTSSDRWRGKPTTNRSSSMRSVDRHETKIYEVMNMYYYSYSKLIALLLLFNYLYASRMFRRTPRQVCPISNLDSQSSRKVR